MSERLLVAKCEAWALWRAAVLQARETAQVKTALVVSVIQPVVLLVLVSEGGLRADPRRTTETVFGCMMIALWSATLWGAGTLLRREMAQGTFAALLVRPTSLLSVLLGKTLGIAALGLVRTAVATAAAVPLLGLRPALPGASTTAIVIASAVLSAAAMGLLLGCVVFLSRANLRIIEALGYPVFVLGGLVVPPEMLPSVLRWPAQAVSLRHLSDLVRDTAHGQAPHPAHLVAVLLLTTLYLTGGVWALSVVLRRGRVRGSLELV
ncbi:ABC transporter permease [Streptomyces sp. NPDC048507]|uniref:ABC transporter permease n=1 Tax=Streptomyces sp. NPDC048507 TaxID=3365560 RepID=UPI00371AE124